MEMMMQLVLLLFFLIDTVNASTLTHVQSKCYFPTGIQLTEYNDQIHIILQRNKGECCNDLVYVWDMYEVSEDY